MFSIQQKVEHRVFNMDDFCHVQRNDIDEK